MRYLTFIFSFLLLVSCKKNNTVTGRVYNPVNNKGIAGIKIDLITEKNCISINGCKDKVIETTYTDAGGYYSIPYRERDNGQFLKFEYDINAYYSMDSYIPYIEGNDKYDFRLVAKGYEQYSVINTNCFDSNDKLIITQRYHKSLPNLILLNGSAIYPGCMNQTNPSTLVPMGWYVWKGTVTKNNITTPFSDSVYVPEGGSVQWSIEY